MNRLQRIKLAALGAALVLPVATASIHAAAEEVTVKLWARADRSGPLRAGNIVAAAEPLNAALKAAGSDKTVKVEVFEGPATGFDADALDILKAFSVNQGPDVYVAAHEWVGEFAKSGYAMDLEDFVKANPWAFADVIPVLWEATKSRARSTPSRRIPRSACSSTTRTCCARSARTRPSSRACRRWSRRASSR